MEQNQDNSTSKFGRLFKRKNQTPNKHEDSNKGNKPESDTPDVSTTIEDGLGKSRSSLLDKIGHAFKSSFDINDKLFDDLEDILISSDVGIEASFDLVEKLRARVKKTKIQDAAGVIQGLKTEIANMLAPAQADWDISSTLASPYVIVVVGVNGVGKTTSTAKIARKLQQQGKSVMMAAADTFRAAAVEQLKEWGQRLDIPVIAQQTGSDAAAVAHDALTSAISRNIDVLLIDTAGRLHTQSDLMEQLQKVLRVIKKLDENAPHEVLQVLDAGTGQNALSQIDHFQNAVNVSSLCLTKLDGSAKGGVAIALTNKYKLPIRYIGIGEDFDDLRKFDAQSFADALVPDLKTG